MADARTAWAQGLLMALSRHGCACRTCPLLGVKRTSRTRAPMSANDPNGHCRGRWDGVVDCFRDLSLTWEALARLDGKWPLPGSASELGI